ncbi:MAG TPA: hydroxymethylbilane synthase [Terriglobia bacterium]|nr:hydroxymethylbilane synthase [Terriglobia bacterium]
MTIVIGTRGSKLALWQANWVRDQLVTAGAKVEIRIIRTTGDKLANVPLTQSGTKGLFIKEIEEALAEGIVDLAVHSLKDLPTEQPPGLTVAAVPPREDARDVLISRLGSRDGAGLMALPAGSKVGTSSLRRQSQSRALRRDVEVVPIRGNLDTRLRKLDAGEYDALVVAAAGIHRLGLRQRVTEYFAVDAMCPAVGQGALAIEVRKGDDRIERAVQPLDHWMTHQAVRAERAALRELGGGCQVPIAVHAQCEDDRLHLLGVVAAIDGRRIVRAANSGPASEPDRLGTEVARSLAEQGAREILTTVTSDK